MVPEAFVNQEFRESGLSSSALVVWLCILGHRNRTTGKCNPGVDRVVRLTGLSRSSVLRAIAGLENAGWLLVRKDQGRSNSYAFPHLESASAKETVNPEVEEVWKAYLAERSGIYRDRDLVCAEPCLTPARASQIRAAVENYGRQDVLRAISAVQFSPFHLGEREDGDVTPRLLPEDVFATEGKINQIETLRELYYWQGQQRETA